LWCESGSPSNVEEKDLYHRFSWALFLCVGLDLLLSGTVLSAGHLSLVIALLAKEAEQKGSSNGAVPEYPIETRAYNCI
jgi:hypothetical protein